MAQETIPMYQQYLFDSEFLFNPRILVNTDDVNFGCQPIKNNFQSLMNLLMYNLVGIHANAFDRVGIGAYFFHDQNGTNFCKRNCNWSFLLCSTQ